MTEYQVLTTNTPPVLRLIDGALFIEVIFGEQTFRAPVGDGSYFVSQVMEKLVTPALLAAYPRVAGGGLGSFKPDPADRRFAFLDYASPYASPND